MRRAVVLLLLLGLMFGVSLLKAEASGSVDPLTLAAIGFVVLASFSAAELGSRLGLPRVTGYILSGLVLGPSLLNILSRTVVQEMQMFNTLALGLIATAAGLELDLKQIVRVGRTLLATVGIKVVLCLLIVGGATVTMFNIFGMPIADVDGAGWALALVFGALAIGTSPAIVLAVLRDGGASGRLSDLILGAAVLKDVVVVVVLAVALAVAAAIIGGGGFDVQVLTHVGRELGASTVAGVILGVLLIAYMRFVRSEMLLFVSAMVLVVGELSRALHLELLLVFIAAGFVVRNFSRHEHALSKPMEMVSLPVFVVFFTIVGAGIDVAGTLAILPLALVLFAARVGAFWGAARLGGRIGGESDVIVSRAFLGYLPQAGVTLGLIGLAAARLPELAEAITSAGMAVVAINLLIGPVALKSSLRSAGELADESPSQEAKAPPADEVSVASMPALSVAHEPSPSGSLADEIVGLMHDDGLGEELRQLAIDLEAIAATTVAEHFVPRLEAFKRATISALEGEEGHTLHQWSVAPHADHLVGHARRCRQLSETIRGRLRELSEHRQVTLGEWDLQRQPEDSLVTRCRRGWQRLRRRLGRPLRPRRVALRLAARTALEPHLAQLCLDLTAGSARSLGAINQTMMVHAAGRLEIEQTRERVIAHLTAAKRHREADIRHALAQGLVATAELWRRHGGPSMPTAELRYSNVQPAVRANLVRLDEQAELWRGGLAASQRCVQMVANLLELQRLVTEAIERHVTAPAMAALQGAQELVGELREALAAGNDLSDHLAERDHPALEALLYGLRASASIHAVAVQMRHALQDTPEECVALHASTPISAADRPEELLTWTVNLRQAATESLLHDMLPTLDARLDATARTLALAGPRVREAMDVARHALNLGQDGDDETPDAAEVSAALGRADRLLERLHGELQEGSKTVTREFALLATQTFERLQAIPVGGHDELATGELGASLGAQALAWLGGRFAPLRALVERVSSRLLALLRRLRGSRLGAEWQVRASSRPLDAIVLRGHAEAWTHVAGLPEAYRRLFTPRPVREHRLFTARRDTLDTLLLAEREWAAGQGNPTLLVGQQGSGRTSLLNMCELELKVTRLLRLDPADGRRRGGLEPALALELNCRHTVGAITKALRSAPTAVLVDDLERWLSLDSDLVVGLNRFLRLVRRTRGAVLWIVVTTHGSLRLLDTVAPVSAAFPRVVDLPPLDHVQLRRSIEARHRLSGRDLVYPGGGLTRLLGRLTGADDATLFFRLLARSSSGNLTRAAVVWMRALNIDGDEVVRPSLQRVLSLGLPSFTSLDPAQVALLLCALRFGGASTRQLQHLLGVSQDDLNQHAGFLRASGLLEPCAPPRDELRVPDALVGPVIDGLRELGVEP